MSSDDHFGDPTLEPTIAEPNDPLVGRLVGRYQVIAMVAKGGTATVYRAMDTVLNREVALKLLHEHLESKKDVVERFKKEALMIAQLRHANVLDVYDFFDFGGRAALIVEFMPGITLSTLIKQVSKVPEHFVLMITLEILKGLKAAHDKGITHRDIKPANVLLHPELGVKISDFGLAKITQHDDGLTKDGVFVGTPSFSSPEQIEGRPIDRRSDLFSLGLTTYILATRSHAFKQKGDSTTTVWFKIVKGRFEAVRDLDPTLSPELDRIISRALQVDVEKRYQSADEMIKDVEGVLRARGEIPYEEKLKIFLQDPVKLTAKTTVAFKSASVLGSQKKWIRGILAGGILLAAATTGYYFYQSRMEKESVLETTQEVTAPSVPDAQVVESTPATTPPAAVEPAPAVEPEATPETPPPPAAPISKPAPSRPSPTVVKDVPIPEAIPVAKASVFVVSDPKRVPGYRWEWKSKGEFQLGADASFKRILAKSSSETTLKELKSISYGSYFWRAGNTEKGSLKIQSPSQYQRSKLVSTKRVVTVSSRFDDVDLELDPYSQDLRFDWAQAPAANSFKLEVATDPEMKNPIFSGTLVERSFLLARQWDRSVVVFWRLSYRDERGNVFLIDPVRRINLKLDGQPPFVQWIAPKTMADVSKGIQLLGPLGLKIECSDVRKDENALRWTLLQSTGDGQYRAPLTSTENSKFVVCRYLDKTSEVIHLIQPLESLR